MLILSFGGTIERMLEYFAWTMLGVVFLFLVAINIAFVPMSHWWETFTGFFSFSGLPQPIDWGAHRRARGDRRIGRDRQSDGHQLDSRQGLRHGRQGRRHSERRRRPAIQLSHVGTVFPATPENLARWREWMRYVHADQIWVWGLFCFLGMFLNVNLATAIIPHGTDLRGSRPARTRRST